MNKIKVKIDNIIENNINIIRIKNIVLKKLLFLKYVEPSINILTKKKYKVNLLNFKISNIKEIGKDFEVHIYTKILQIKKEIDVNKKEAKK